MKEGRANLAGLGEIVVRESRAFGGKDPRTGKMVSVAAKRLPMFMVDAAARSYLNQGGRAPAGSFSAALEEASQGAQVVLGALGRLCVVRKPGAEGAGVLVPARSVMSLHPSQTLRRTLAGTRPVAMLEAEVTAWLAKSTEVKVPKGGAKQLAKYLQRELPETRPLVEDDDRETAQAEHEMICERHNVASGKVFAAITVGETAPEDRDHWVLLSKAADPIVARTQGRRRPVVALSGWLRAMTALRELGTLAKDRVLAPADARRVLAHIDAMAPGVAETWDALPY